MAIKSGYFNSVSGDRKYNAEDMTMYFKGLVSDGVYQTVGNMLAVTPGDGLTVNLDTGRALVNMHWMENDSMVNIDLGSASVSAEQYKLIVLRCDLSENVRSVAVTVKDSASGAVVLKNDENIKELCLARVRIRKNASTISQSDVRDYRGSTYCPWITGLIQQVDVSKLNKEFYAYYDEQTKALDAWLDQQKKDFESWLSTLQSELTVNTKLKTYQSVFTTTEETTEIPLIEQYEAGDSILIHIGGVLFVETDEFEIDTGNRKIILKNPVMKGNTITQYLTKSTIGNGSSGSGGGGTYTLSRDLTTGKITLTDNSGSRQEVNINPLVSEQYSSSVPFALKKGLLFCDWTISGGANTAQAVYCANDIDIVCAQPVQGEYQSGSIVTFNTLGAKKEIFLGKDGKFRKSQKSGWSNTECYEYILPDKSGTLALLSDIPESLPLFGGTMSGNIDTATNKTEIIVSADKSGVENLTVVAGGTVEASGQMTANLPNKKSFVGTYHDTTNDVWYNIVSIRHRNGYNDGNKSGMVIYSDMSATDNIKWNKQNADGTWQGVRTLLDTTNFSKLMSTKLTNESLNDGAVNGICGFFYADADNTCTNTAVSGKAFFMIAIRISANLKMQVAFYPHNNKMYMRSWDGNDWTAWA